MIDEDGVFHVQCNECGGGLEKDEDGLWSDGGDPWSDPPRAGFTCWAGNDPTDYHKPNLDLPDNTSPEEVEAWLARP